MSSKCPFHVLSLSYMSFLYIPSVFAIPFQSSLHVYILIFLCLPSSYGLLGWLLVISRVCLSAKPSWVADSLVWTECLWLGSHYSWRCWLQVSDLPGGWVTLGWATLGRPNYQGLQQITTLSKRWSEQLEQQLDQEVIYRLSTVLSIVLVESY